MHCEDHVADLGFMGVMHQEALVAPNLGIPNIRRETLRVGAALADFCKASLGPWRTHPSPFHYEIFISKFHSSQDYLASVSVAHLGPLGSAAMPGAQRLEISELLCPGPE